MSEVDDLAEHAAGLLCAVGIYHNDQEALDFIMSHQFGEKQQGQICFQAVSSFNLDEYHEKSKIVLIYLMDHSSDELRGFNRLFFDRCIVIQRDEEFLIHLMESRQSVHLFHYNRKMNVVILPLKEKDNVNIFVLVESKTDLENELDSSLEDILSNWVA